MKRFLIASMLMLAASPAFAQRGTTPPAQTPRPPATTVPSTLPPPSAQTPYSGQAPRGTPPGLVAESHGWNLRLEIAITDTYSGTPVKKVVSMIVVNHSNGMIRTTNEVGGNEVLLNIDAVPAVYPLPSGQMGNIRLRLTLQYTPAPVPDTARLGPSRPAGLHESLTVNLTDGKPLVISQSADPATDRKVTLEVTATVLK